MTNFDDAVRDARSTLQCAHNDKSKLSAAEQARLQKLSGEAIATLGLANTLRRKHGEKTAIRKIQNAVTNYASAVIHARNAAGRR
ncbi:hypothetical protein [Amycolatopsis sp. NPDC001319]|uniref:hypothetical protein n=1 Tax=unclassified Amycolatopsis TaxID=2618356 RepID=UPI0036937CC7